MAESKLLETAETIQITCEQCGKSYQIPEHQLGVWCDCFLKSNSKAEPVFVPNPFKPVIVLGDSVLSKVEKLAEFFRVPIDTLANSLLRAALEVLEADTEKYQNFLRSLNNKLAGE